MTTLPIATPRRMRASAWRLLLRYPGQLVAVLSVHGLSAAFGLVGPWLLGNLVEDVAGGAADVTRVAVLVLVFIATQALCSGIAVYLSARLGEKVLAELREDFVAGVLAIPLATVEHGSGDILTRTTRDIDTLARCVRQAVPDVLICAVTVVITIGGIVLLGPLLALPCLVAVPFLWASTRWYLARAHDGYLREAAAYSLITEGLTESVRGARTVDALRLGSRRMDRANRDIAGAYAAERYTLRLRTVYLPVADMSYVLPVVATLVIGGLLHIRGMVSLAAVTAATLYTQQLLVPVDRMLFWLNEIQTGGAALARVIGIECHRPEAHTEGDHDVPQANDVRVRGLTYAYRAGRDVLRALELDVAPGERLAVVGPSGAGKSTLGRLLAGIYRPRTGTITAGGASLSDLPFERLRQQVALVTQEHHVFRATLRENVAMVRPDVTDDELERALRAVGAWEWARPLGLDTPLGAGRVELSPAHAQQLALARIVVAAPHTLVLDEATAFLTPQAARALEQSLQSVLSGRTVIAIAHRLHTAHDADRIAMMLDGRIVETGSHNQLIERGERYAALWESWCRGSEEPAGNIN